jgi:hypothetical protein
MESSTITQFDLLKERIEFDKDVFTDNDTYIKILNRLLEDSKYVGLSLRFPYQDYSKLELPKKYNNWQIRCCVEIYEQIGTIGLKSYAENGLSWTRDSTYISNELRGEIEPMIGYIEVGDEEDEIQTQE